MLYLNSIWHALIKLFTFIYAITKITNEKLNKQPNETHYINLFVIYECHAGWELKSKLNSLDENDCEQ